MGAHVIRITDGTTTKNLYGGPIYPESYAPATPPFSVAEVERMVEGGEVLEVVRNNVEEEGVFLFTGATTDAIRADVNDVEKLLRQAEHYQVYRRGKPVYLEFQPGGAGDVYRSRLLYGSATWGPEALGVQWPGKKFDVALRWRRTFYWEGPEVELALTNGGGSGTGGRTVYNHDDGGANHDNYVAISGSAVGGVIPTPPRIEVTNSYNNSNRLYRLCIGHNVYSAPGSFPHILEGENKAYAAGGRAPVANSDCSNGYYQDADVLGYEAQCIRWTLNAALLNAAQGNYFRLLLRAPNATNSGIRIKPKITFPSGTPLTVVAEGAETLLGSGYLTDLGVIQIPPWLPGETDLCPVDLTFYARKAGGGVFYCDFIQLTCLDGYRHLVPRGYGAAYQVRLVDDGIADLVWTDEWGGGGKTGHYLAEGRRIYLWPGKDQRLYFLAENDVANSEILRTESIRVYVRPRRLSL